MDERRIGARLGFIHIFDPTLEQKYTLRPSLSSKH